MKNSLSLLLIVFTFSISSCAQNSVKTKGTQHKYEIEKTEAEWKAQLTDLEYQVLREEGTERALTPEDIEEARKALKDVGAGGGTPISLPGKQPGGGLGK